MYQRGTRGTAARQRSFRSHLGTGFSPKHGNIVGLLVPNPSLLPVAVRLCAADPGNPWHGMGARWRESSLTGNSFNVGECCRNLLPSLVISVASHFSSGP